MSLNNSQCQRSYKCQDYAVTMAFVVHMEDSSEGKQLTCREA